MARGVHALRASEPGALFLLISAAAAYGFVHAVGPGHGKYLIGGVGLGSRVSSRRLVGIALTSSLAQSVWAIILVYGGFWLLQSSAQHLTSITEDLLAPISYLAIGMIGALLIWRGTRGLSRAVANSRHAGHAHTEAECGCSSHRLNHDDVAQLKTVRDTVALVLSVAVRPCTGAVLVLIIAWQLDLQIAGMAAVIAMGLGTGALVSVVALSSVGLRGFAQARLQEAAVAHVAAPCLQLLAGGLIIWFSVSILYVGGYL
ncbi:MAG: hypothetical protein AAF415_08315 [Pseudomonadota bacterium]